MEVSNLSKAEQDLVELYNKQGTKGRAFILDLLGLFASKPESFAAFKRMFPVDKGAPSTAALNAFLAEWKDGAVV